MKKEILEQLNQYKTELSNEWKKRKKSNGGERDEAKIKEIQSKISDLKKSLNA